VAYGWVDAELEAGNVGQVEMPIGVEVAEQLGHVGFVGAHVHPAALESGIAVEVANPRVSHEGGISGVDQRDRGRQPSTKLKVRDTICRIVSRTSHETGKTRTRGVAGAQYGIL